MATRTELNVLVSALETCLEEADRLKISMAGLYVAHAIEHLQHVEPECGSGIVIHTDRFPTANRAQR